MNNQNAYYLTILTGDYTSEQNFYDHSRAKKIKLEYEMNVFEDSKSKLVKIDTIISIPDFKYYYLIILLSVFSYFIFKII